VRRDEGEHLRPRVVGRVGELLLLAVEEAVRRSLVGVELVVDSRRAQGSLERSVVRGGDVLVGSRLQREDRRLEIGRALCRARCAVATLARPAVEADRAGEPEVLCGGEPRVPPAEAKPRVKMCA
jgi:hypothetical protein